MPPMPIYFFSSQWLNLRNGSAIVARFFMDFEQKFTKPRNADLTSEVLVGGGVSFKALTLSSEIFMPVGHKFQF